MKKALLVLSFFFSLIGILSTFFLVFFKIEYLNDFTGIILSLKPHYFSGLNTYLETERRSDNSTSGIILPLLNLFFYLTLLSGSIIYYISKYKETRLLSFNYSIAIINGLVGLSFFALVDTNKTSPYLLYKVVGIVITIIIIFISYYIIKKPLNETISATEITDDITLENSSNYKRFLNLIIDTILILSITYGYFEFSERSTTLTTFYEKLHTAFGTEFSILLYIYIIKFIYYLVYESLFKSTPAKFLTGCYITDENGNQPDFSMILKRTLCRFIPFESFSFLMGKNLHDDYSDTYVVNKKTDAHIEKRYLLVLGISFCIMLIYYYFNRY
ncbi:MULTISPECIES: RDD family protein [Flavobacterium]|uniref:RDD domain-containing protein n=1 Tax=Flavobacterium ginsengisoli TaxID=871694 RepID=A0ABP7FMI0_9FLAO|nr:MULTISPECIES: RDD family protein [Flavobacterium]MBJ2124688.1 RDD family protein [Flavobacterium sp. IB48]